MSDTCGITNIDDNSLPIEDFNDVCYSADYATLGSVYLENCPKMISNNQYSVSGNISNSSFASEDSLGDNILEENGRISLAYENLRTIPKRIAEKFAMQTKFLDLSYNNFQNLSFLSFFEDLHTLILDRNTKLDLNTLPFLQNLKILWINNCDIRNVANWIQRIRVQCPSLEYLSIMGNPGIKEPFNNSNLNMFNNLTNIDSMMLTTGIISDYRGYILQMLPYLQYLDGVSRESLMKVLKCPINHSILPLTPSSSLSASVSIENGSSSQGQQYNDNSHRKISPSLSFKDLFRLKRRKKSYPSSSTN
ncbi:misexpression suppressor of KSR 4 isoform 3-T3 [Cochliomyia hominivorax]